MQCLSQLQASAMNGDGQIYLLVTQILKTFNMTELPGTEHE